MALAAGPATQVKGRHSVARSQLSQLWAFLNMWGVTQWVGPLSLSSDNS